MGVRVDEQAGARLTAAGASFAVQVQHASDVHAAIGALKLARVDLLGLVASTEDAAPKPLLSPVVNAPGGPLVLVEHASRDEAVRLQVPTVVAARLEQARVESANVTVPTLGGVLDGLDGLPNAVVLRLFPTAPDDVRRQASASALPPDWLDMACDWLVGDASVDEIVRLRIVGVEFDVTVADVPSALHECGLGRAWCDAVSGDLTDRIRTASLTFGRLPHLALASGGPGVDGAGLIARFELLQDVARELAADLAYACIDFEPTFEGLGLGLAREGWERSGGASPNEVARTSLNDHVPDAYPFQVLGPGQVDRLGAAGRTLPGELLGDGRVEVTLDEPRAWLRGSGVRPSVQAEGWDVLRPLLATAGDLPDDGAADSRDEGPDSIGAAEAELLPDLSSIVLEPGGHLRRGTRLTVLELASWLAHEPHSDAPTSVSPVLATFLRWWSSGLDHDTRQRLKPVAARVLGTASRGDDAESMRRWLAADWLVRVCAPAWLRAAGLVEAAERLTALGPLTDKTQLMKAVEILGGAVTIASRRIEITASIVADGDPDGEPPDSHLVWDAWERVSEATAWVAASEAATEGVPAEVVYATDLRVIEVARDRRARDELEAGRLTIGGAAWSAGVQAIADELWDRGWRAADGAARDLSGFTIRIEMGRVAKSVLEKIPASEDEGELPEVLLEQAEQAARASLAEAALGPADPSNGEHPWDVARNAARTSMGGEAWSVVIEEARRTIGEDTWAQAMGDAREVTSDLLRQAPDAVARVVAASVAREAASAAARGLALRAAAVARANGGDEQAAAAAIDEALARTAATLQDEGFTLLDRLIDPALSP